MRRMCHFSSSTFVFEVGSASSTKYVIENLQKPQTRYHNQHLFICLCRTTFSFNHYIGLGPENIYELRLKRIGQFHKKVKKQTGSTTFFTSSLLYTFKVFSFITLNICQGNTLEKPMFYKIFRLFIVKSRSLNH